MPLPVAALAIAGVGALVGAIVSAIGEENAQDLMEEARARYGELNPQVLEEIVAERLGPSALAQVKADARLKEAQYSALEKMKGIEDGGGFDEADWANLNRTRNEAARADSANRANVLETMQARGVAGSGAEIAANLQSSQSAANRQYQGALDVAGDARRRYFEAIKARGAMAGDMRGQDFRERSQAAQAADTRDQLNWGRRFDVQRMNNDARQQNYQNQKGILDKQYDASSKEAESTRNQYDKFGRAASDIGTAGAAFKWESDREDDEKEKP